jgi:hypothetical protein
MPSVEVVRSEGEDDVSSINILPRRAQAEVHFAPNWSFWSLRRP